VDPFRQRCRQPQTQDSPTPAYPTMSQPNHGETTPHDIPVPRTGEDGKPIYDQEFFLVLARHGRDVWNRWRAENPGIKRIRTTVLEMGLDFDLKDMRFRPESHEVADEPKHIKVNFESVDFRQATNLVVRSLERVSPGHGEVHRGDFWR
jgi:hypothetical protein